ncbi:MAG: hypothetical protein AAF328_06150 [Planctomycetota bacterium]
MLSHTRFKPSRTWPMHWLRGGGLAMAWLPGGVLRGVWAVPEAWTPEQDIPGEAVRINGLLGDPVGGGAMRLLLRARSDHRVVAVFDALRDATDVSFETHRATWRGVASGLAWSASVAMAEGTSGAGWQWQWQWQWQFEVRRDEHSAINSDADAWDAIVVHDLALASEAAARNNEKYVGQYLDLRLLDAKHANSDSRTDLNPCLLARQALPQPGGTHPGMFAAGTHMPGVMTDLVAFFGTGFKATATPEHARTTTLPTGILQHETPAAILQSQPLAFGSRDEFRFQYVPDHPEATGTADDLTTASELHGARPLPNPALEHASHRVSEASNVSSHRPNLRPSDPPTDAHLAAWFGDPKQWRHLERHADTTAVASFFHGPPDAARHVATYIKDNALRRGHGHILRTGRAWLPDDRSVCCTVYQHGVFASQLTVGNTTFGQLCSIARDPINLNHATGLRLFVQLDDGTPGDEFVQLGQAGAFEMAPGWCRWWYVLGERVIRVQVAASPDAPALRYEAKVLTGPPMRFALRQHVSIGELEDGYATDVTWNQQTGIVTACPGDHEHRPWIAREFPELACHWAFDEPSQVARFATVEIGSYWTVETTPTATLGWAITASPDGLQDAKDTPEDFQTTADAADSYWSALCGLAPANRNASENADASDLERLHDAVPWMTHNAMIHLTVPHGLEQFGGAAWGTRDVCQGPTEMLRAMGRSDVLADVLRVVFRHQHRQTGDWPQWFMHPPFHAVQAGDSHGDVVIWPLYALAHYLEMGGAVSLLDDVVAWTDRDNNFAFTEEADPIRAHVDRAIQRIVSQRIPGTALPRYGHGDWNDALQPANRDFADRMVSSWTVALLADTLQRLAEALRELDPLWSSQLAQHAAQVHDDFQTWCVVHDPATGVNQVAGILLFDENFKTAEPLLHPTDTRTGIQHSLIPMNRALLGGLLTDAQAAHHQDVIKRQLLAPDGVRLMERPPAYAGGVSTVFQRAESAAFFGREVGLMYTHAHLRTVESWISAGRPVDALRLLNRINPVGITDPDTGVANAAPRQANAYFSSSDARFATRYHADAHHADVLTGKVVCDGGWRVYSSGPGIFLWLLRRAIGALRDSTSDLGSKSDTSR